jgi:sialate O-acetylesterase
MMKKPKASDFMPVLLFVFAMIMSVAGIPSAFADIKLPNVLSSNMVLQQKTTINLWGIAEKDETIVISIGWQTEKITTTADPDGKWRVAVKTIGAGGPYTIEFSGKNTLILKNVMLGEVWFCSGQSNMEFPIYKMGGWKKNQADLADLLNNDYSSIRLCQVVHAFSDTLRDDCKARWMVPDSTTLKNFSAVAWYYGNELSKKLHVPVGLILSACGGSTAEAWTEYSALKGDQNLSYFLNKEYPDSDLSGKPSLLFNTMVYPFRLFPIKGVIWYQGEANTYDADLYHQLFAAMIKNWRATWNTGDFPFYYVQIAPYDYKSKCNASAYLREAQLQSLDITNTAMAVTLDIGDKNDIHPVDKLDVGKRLSLLALAHTYMMGDLNTCTGPLFESMQAEGNKLRIKFSHAAGGLMTKDTVIRGFEVAGADHVFVPAKAVISGSDVIVSSVNVVLPVDARYAFSDTAKASVFNREGLPASPFRTDKEAFFFRTIHLDASIDSLSGALFANLSVKDNNAEIRYTLDGSDPNIKSKLFSGKIAVGGSVQIKARAFDGRKQANNISSLVFNASIVWKKKVQYLSIPSEKYKGNKYSLTDGIRGSENFKDKFWVGFLGDDALFTIDLDTIADVKKIKLHFLHDIANLIFSPQYVDIYTAGNYGQYHLARNINIPPDLQKIKDAYIKEIEATLDVKGVRFIKIMAKNSGLCPVFSVTQKAWLFIDDVEVY